MKTNHNLLKILVNILLLFIIVDAIAQENDLLRNGPRGMLVFLGKNIPSGKPVSSIRIERKAGSGEYKIIGETKFPADVESFLKENMKNHENFPHQPMPKEEDLRSFYSEAGRQSSMDSIKLMGVTMVERITAGNIFYDAGIKPGTDVSYRITHLDRSGNSVFQMVSKSSAAITPMIKDIPSLADLRNNTKNLYLRWISVGKSPGKFFSVFRNDKGNPVECKGTNVRYQSHDTTTFIFSMPVGKDFSMTRQSLFLVTCDQYEFPGESSPIVIVEQGSFDNTSFLKARAKKLSDRLGMQVSWKLDNPESVKRIEIFRSDELDNKYDLLVTVSGTDTAFIDPNVIPDKNTFYHLVAIGTYPFQKKESNYFSGTAMDTQKPVTPSIILASAIHNGVEVKVQVNDSYIYGMRVYRNNGTGDSLQPVSDLVPGNGPTITFRDTSKILNGYRSYIYKVRTESFSHLMSDYSGEVFLRPGIQTVPSSPGNLHGWITDNQARLFWDDGENQPGVITGYQVTRTEVNPQAGAPAGNPVSLTADSILRSNFINDSTLAAGKTYNYSVFTIDRNRGKSISSASLVLNFPEHLPIPPAGLQAQKTENGIVLKWGSAEFDKLSFYRIYRYQRGTDPVILKLAGKNETTYTDHSAITGELYFYYLTSVDKSDKESEPCDEVGITR